jgi:biotin carboxylase
MESLASSYALTLLDRAAPTWQLPYLRDFAVARLDDVGHTVAVARRVAARQPVRGVLTYDERALPAAAAVAEALGLPGNSPEAVARCRDKLLTRQALFATDDAVRSVPVGTIDEARDAAADLGYPVVLKPRGLAGSFGVVRVDTQAELNERFEAVRRTTFPGLDGYGTLVEEYLEGAEISAECAVDGERIEVVAVARKEVGLVPFFEEQGHVVCADDPLRVDAELRERAVAVHRRLGLTTGVTHAEFRLTSRGIRLVEVNARLAGDLIPRLVQLATGADLSGTAAALACGQPPPPAGTGVGCAAVRFLYPPHAVRVERLHEVSVDAPWLERVRWEVDPGTDLGLPPDAFMSRLGHAIVVGATPQECRARLDEVEGAMRDRIEFGPRPDPAGGR